MQPSGSHPTTTVESITEDPSLASPDAAIPPSAVLSDDVQFSEGMIEAVREADMEGTLTALRNAIWDRRPVLGEIMGKHGDGNFYTYTKDFLDVNASPALDGRKEELIGTMEALLTPRLGYNVARGVSAQLRRLALVTTADHHGPIQHPFFVNSNLVSALPYAEKPEAELQYIVSLPFASVSLNNSSTFTRGVLLHGNMNGTKNLVRIPLFPDKLKMGVVYKTRAMTAEDVEHGKQGLCEKNASFELETNRCERMCELLDELYLQPNILEDTDLNSQITKLTYALWPRLFHPAKGKDTSKRPPDLIYLEIETLVSEVLIRYHLRNRDSLIWKILFDAKYRELMLTHFNNLQGAFSLEKESGTYIFWGLDEKQRRLKLRLENNVLTTHDGSFQCALNADEIEDLLRARKIYPSMLLCYLMTSLYYGMKCLGGFCQVHHMTLMKQAWQKVLRASGNTDEANAIEPVQTKEINCGMVLSYMRTHSGAIVPATGFDMMLDDGDTSFDHFIDLSKRVTLNEMMNPMLPEMYTVFYPIDERNPELADVVPERIFEQTGMTKKLLGAF